MKTYSNFMTSLKMMLIFISSLSIAQEGICFNICNSSEFLPKKNLFPSFIRFWKD